MHIRVSIHLMPTREAALQTIGVMSSLRHPNLELLLGAVVDAPEPCVVTELVNGFTVGANIKRAAVLRTAVTIGMHVARALVYYHTATGRAHAAVSAHCIAYDEARSRAVLLLMRAERAAVVAPELRAGARREAFAGDVYCLATVILQMLCGSLEVYGADRVREVPKRLLGGLKECRRGDPARRPSMGRLCEILNECADGFS